MLNPDNFAPAMAKQLKTKQVALKFSETETQRFTRLAEDEHLPLATYLRRLIYKALENSNGQQA